MRRFALLSLLVLPLSGCIGGEAASEPATVYVTDDTLDANEGIIHGVVYAEWGAPLPDVRVSVIGTSVVGKTDAKGIFEFIGIPTGTKTVRIEADRFFPEERAVDVVPEAPAHVEATLKLIDQSGAARPHLHDWWQGAPQIVIGDVMMHWNNPYNNDLSIRWFGKDNPVTAANPVHGTHRQNNNQTGEDPDYLMRIPVPETLEDGFTPALVYPGAGEVQVTVAWDAPTTKKDRLGIVAIPPEGGYNDLLFFRDSPVESGGTASLSIPANMTDNGHQPWSQWSFFLFNPNALGEDDWDPEYTYGEDFHVIVTAVKGSDVPAEPPHRDFWADGPVKELQIYDEQVIDPLDARDWRVRNSGHLFLDEGVLIPPGTQRIEMEFVYGNTEESNDFETDDRILTFRAADQNRWTTGLGDYRRTDGTPCDTERSGAKCVAYAFDVEPSWTDQYYQQESLWTFLSSVPGNEDNRNYGMAHGDFTFILDLTLYGPGA